MFNADYFSRTHSFFIVSLLLRSPNKVGCMSSLNMLAIEMKRCAHLPGTGAALKVGPADATAGVGQRLQACTHEAAHR